MGSQLRRQLLQYGVAPVVIAIGASCGLVTDSCACSLPPGPFVGVAGTVTDESGATLEGIHVTLTVRDVTCQELLAGPMSAATDAAGAYALGITGEEEGVEACGEIEALRALTASVDTVRSTVDLTFAFEPPDTLDLVFPTR